MLWRPRFRCSRIGVAAGLLTIAGVASGLHAGAQQTPTFRASVDLVAVDVQVVTGNGLPITGLGPDKFEVSINGQRRRVVSAELVRHDTASIVSSAGPQPTAQRPAAAALPLERSSEGRIYVIAIDLLSFRPDAAKLVASAARGFVEKLQPTDRVGLAAFPSGLSIDPTTDHAPIINGLEKAIGEGEPPIAQANRFGLHPSNIVDLTVAVQRDGMINVLGAPRGSAIRKSVDDVCAYDNDQETCERWVISDAQTLALHDETVAVQRLGALRGILAALAGAPGRKTLVLISAGLPATDIPGGRPDLGDLGLLVGQEAARANTTIYALHVDSRRRETASAGNGGRARPTDNQSRDSAILSRPLDQITGLSGGALFTVVQGGGEAALDRIRSETSSLYLLGVEPAESDRTGEPRQLRVRVDSGQRGAIVRARTWVVVPKPGSVVPVLARTPPTATPRVATIAPTAEEVATYERLFGGAAGNAPAKPTGDSAATTERPAARTAFDELFATYSSGDRSVLIRELGSQADFERVRPDLMSTLARWRRDWSPERAGFAFEIALTAFARGWPNPSMYLNAARDIVVARPDAPGAVPDGDAFELRFHRAAVALLAALDGPHGVEAYLASIQHRVAIGNAAPKGPALKDARLLMAQATAREVQTLMILASVGSRRDDPWVWAVAKDDGRLRRQLEAVGELLERASADEETHAEASVRRAFIQYRLGQHPSALALVTAAAPKDDVVGYWRALVQGRVLVALGRGQDAIEAFERAAALAPKAQTPAVALATLYLKQGDRQRSFVWAERARTTTDNGADSWPLYWRGAGRFLAPWIEDLRENAR